MITPIQCKRKPAGSSEPFRFVHDLRNVNDVLPTQRVRMEGIKELLQSIQIGDWMITWDLEAGYHHVAVEKKSRVWLGFQWKGKIY